MVDVISEDFGFLDECLSVEDELVSSLNAQQRTVFGWVKSRIRSMDNSTRAMMMIGQAGCGKTHVLQAVEEIYREKVVFCSFTGMASSNFKAGRTIHSTFGLNICENYEECDYTKLKGIFANVKLIVVDEISSVKSSLLKEVMKVCCHLEKILKFKRNSSSRWPLANFLFVGDFAQLDPVMGKSLLDCIWFNNNFFDSDYNPRSNVVVMKSVFRESVLYKYLERIRCRKQTVLSQKHFCYVSYYYDMEDVFGLSLCYSNVMRLLINNLHFGYWRKRVDSYLHSCSECDNVLYLVKGQRVVVTCNGTEFQTIGDTSEIIQFHNGTCLRYESVCERGLYFSHPLSKSEMYFYKFKEVTVKNEIGCYVTHIHVNDIESAAALTVHKVQGQTLDRGIIVLERNVNGVYVEICPSFFYVCLSRFKSIDDIRICAPVDAVLKFTPDFVMDSRNSNKMRMRSVTMSASVKRAEEEYDSSKDIKIVKRLMSSYGVLYSDVLTVSQNTFELKQGLSNRDLMSPLIDPRCMDTKLQTIDVFCVTKYI